LIRVLRMAWPPYASVTFVLVTCTFAVLSWLDAEQPL
jgi:hypothetical protein